MMNVGLNSMGEEDLLLRWILGDQRFKGYDFMNPSMGEEVKLPEGGPYQKVSNIIIESIVMHFGQTLN